MHPQRIPPHSPRMITARRATCCAWPACVGFGVSGFQGFRFGLTNRQTFLAVKRRLLLQVELQAVCLVVLSLFPDT